MDVISTVPTCTFSCVYCQLGRIQDCTTRRRIFLPNHVVSSDLEASGWREAEVVTYSGSGEPTLAVNLGSVISGIADRTGLPSVVLTSGVLLDDPGVVQDLCRADEVSIKLDASDELMFQQVNRPAPGITLLGIILGIRRFRQVYCGRMTIQVMFLRWTTQQLAALAGLLVDVQPDEVLVNTPTRPYPVSWDIGVRGRHGQPAGKQAIPRVQVRRMAMELSRRTELPVRSVYGHKLPHFRSEQHEVNHAD